MATPHVITADEVNILIHSYFKDSGFQHSAYALRHEARLEASPYFAKHIPRGELVDLLAQALLYRETESHWRDMASGCTARFSLIEPHVCSFDQANVRATPLPPALPKVSAPKTNGDAGAKRKASTPSTDDGRAEKRTKKDSDTEADQPEPSKSKLKEPESAMTTPVSDSQKKTKTKPRPQAQGPVGDASNPHAIRLLQGHKTEIFVCAWNPVKQSLLATGSKDAVVNIWNLANPESTDLPDEVDPPLVLDHFAKSDQGDLTALHWNSDGTLLAIGSYDSILRICTVSGGLYFSHPQHQGPIFAVRFSKSGRWLLTASLDGTTCLWDVTEKRLHLQYRCHTDCCLDVDWLDDSTFGSCGADQVIHLMRVDSPNPIKSLIGHQNEINQIKCNPSRTHLASCSDDMTARVWNIAGVFDPSAGPAGAGVIVLEGHKHSVSSIGWCADTTAGANEIIATSSFDGTARLWDSKTGDCLQVFSDHKRPVYALSFSPNGRWLASGSGDGWLHIYNVKTREKMWSWFAGTEKPGVFEIDWQRMGGVNRIALALECRYVGVVDVARIPQLQDEP